ncbi:hypothetical protein M758_4G232600 [Ceratodon purpureus]|nr:hypothetical protein M758_4G232600 [Ceratodon purpureus]
MWVMAGNCPTVLICLIALHILRAVIGIARASEVVNLGDRLKRVSRSGACDVGCVILPTTGRW